MGPLAGIEPAALRFGPAAVQRCNQLSTGIAEPQVPIPARGPIVAFFATSPGSV